MMRICKKKSVIDFLGSFETSDSSNTRNAEELSRPIEAHLKVLILLSERETLLLSLRKK